MTEWRTRVETTPASSISVRIYKREEPEALWLLVGLIRKDGTPALVHGLNLPPRVMCDAYAKHKENKNKKDFVNT